MGISAGPSNVGKEFDTILGDRYIFSMSLNKLKNLKYNSHRYKKQFSS